LKKYTLKNPSCGEAQIQFYKCIGESSKFVTDAEKIFDINKTDVFKLSKPVQSKV
jgi:hypothetical protein